MSSTINATQCTQGTQSVSVKASPPPPSQSQGSTQVTASPPFASPVIKVDPNSGLALFETRNTTTGAVETQTPSKQVAQQYMHSEQKSTQPSPTSTSA